VGRNLPVRRLLVCVLREGVPLMKNYYVDLAAILEVTGGETEVRDSIELEPLVIGDETFTFTRPIEFAARLTNTAAGVVASGEVHAQVTTECSRCLEQFEMPLDAEIEAFYTPHGDRTGIADEQEVGPIEDNKVDLLPAIVSALAIEAPFAPVCSDECKGICPTCGANRNVEECHCKPEEKESPFSVLKGMFPDEDS
jgi:uncharacterized protein